MGQVDARPCFNVKYRSYNGNPYTCKDDLHGYYGARLRQPHCWCTGITTVLHVTIHLIIHESQGLSVRSICSIQASHCCWPRCLPWIGTLVVGCEMQQPAASPRALAAQRKGPPNSAPHAPSMNKFTLHKHQQFDINFPNCEDYHTLHIFYVTYNVQHNLHWAHFLYKSQQNQGQGATLLRQRNILHISCWLRPCYDTENEPRAVITNPAHHQLPYSFVLHV